MGSTAADEGKIIKGELMYGRKGFQENCELVFEIMEISLPDNIMGNCTKILKNSKTFGIRKILSSKESDQLFSLLFNAIKESSAHEDVDQRQQKMHVNKQARVEDFNSLVAFLILQYVFNSFGCFADPNGVVTYLCDKKDWRPKNFKPGVSLSVLSDDRMKFVHTIRAKEKPCTSTYDRGGMDSLGVRKEICLSEIFQKAIACAFSSVLNLTLKDKKSFFKAISSFIIDFSKIRLIPSIVIDATKKREDRYTTELLHEPGLLYKLRIDETTYSSQVAEIVYKYKRSIFKFLSINRDQGEVDFTLLQLFDTIEFVRTIGVMNDLQGEEIRCVSFRKKMQAAHERLNADSTDISRTTGSALGRVIFGEKYITGAENIFGYVKNNFGLSYLQDFRGSNFSKSLVSHVISQAEEFCGIFADYIALMNDGSRNDRNLYSFMGELLFPKNSSNFPSTLKAWHFNAALGAVALLPISNLINRPGIYKDSCKYNCTELAALALNFIISNFDYVLHGLNSMDDESKHNVVTPFAEMKASIRSTFLLLFSIEKDRKGNSEKRDLFSSLIKKADWTVGAVEIFHFIQMEVIPALQEKSRVDDEIYKIYYENAIDIIYRELLSKCETGNFPSLTVVSGFVSKGLERVFFKKCVESILGSNDGNLHAKYILNQVLFSDKEGDVFISRLLILQEEVTRRQLPVESQVLCDFNDDVALFKALCSIGGLSVKAFTSKLDLSYEIKYSSRVEEVILYFLNVALDENFSAPSFNPSSPNSLKKLESKFFDVASIEFNKSNLSRNFNLLLFDLVTYWLLQDVGMGVEVRSFICNCVNIYGNCLNSGFAKSLSDCIEKALLANKVGVNFVGELLSDLLLDCTSSDNLKSFVAILDDFRRVRISDELGALEQLFKTTLNELLKRLIASHNLGENVEHSEGYTQVIEFCKIVESLVFANANLIANFLNDFKIVDQSNPSKHEDVIFNLLKRCIKDSRLNYGDSPKYLLALQKYCLDVLKNSSRLQQELVKSYEDQNGLISSRKDYDLLVSHGFYIEDKIDALRIIIELKGSESRKYLQVYQVLRSRFVELLKGGDRALLFVEINKICDYYSEKKTNTLTVFSTFSKINTTNDQSSIFACFLLFANEFLQKSIESLADSERNTFIEKFFSNLILGNMDLAPEEKREVVDIFLNNPIFIGEDFSILLDAATLALKCSKGGDSNYVFVAEFIVELMLTVRVNPGKGGSIDSLFESVFDILFQKGVESFTDAEFESLFVRINYAFLSLSKQYFPDKLNFSGDTTKCPIAQYQIKKHSKLGIIYNRILSLGNSDVLSSAKYPEERVLFELFMWSSIKSLDSEYLKLAKLANDGSRDELCRDIRDCFYGRSLLIIEQFFCGSSYAPEQFMLLAKSLDAHAESVIHSSEDKKFYFLEKVAELKSIKSINIDALQMCLLSENNRAVSKDVGFADIFASCASVLLRKKLEGSIGDSFKEYINESHKGTSIDNIGNFLSNLFSKIPNLLENNERNIQQEQWVNDFSSVLIYTLENFAASDKEHIADCIFKDALQFISKAQEAAKSDEFIKNRECIVNIVVSLFDKINQGQTNDIKKAHWTNFLNVFINEIRSYPKCNDYCGIFVEKLFLKNAKSEQDKELIFECFLEALEQNFSIDISSGGVSGRGIEEGIVGITKAACYYFRSDTDKVHKVYQRNYEILLNEIAKRNIEEFSPTISKITENINKLLNPKKKSRISIVEFLVNAGIVQTGNKSLNAKFDNSITFVDLLMFISLCTYAVYIDGETTQAQINQCHRILTHLFRGILMAEVKAAPSNVTRLYKFICEIEKIKLRPRANTSLTDNDFFSTYSAEQEAILSCLCELEVSLGSNKKDFKKVDAIVSCVCNTLLIKPHHICSNEKGCLFFHDSPQSKIWEVDGIGIADNFNAVLRLALRDPDISEKNISDLVVNVFFYEQDACKVFDAWADEVQQVKFNGNFVKHNILNNIDSVQKIKDYELLIFVNICSNLIERLFIDEGQGHKSSVGNFKDKLDLVRKFFYPIFGNADFSKDFCIKGKCQSIVDFCFEGYSAIVSSITANLKGDEYKKCIHAVRKVILSLICDLTEDNFKAFFCKVFSKDVSSSDQIWLEESLCQSFFLHRYIDSSSEEILSSVLTSILKNAPDKFQEFVSRVSSLNKKEVAVQAYRDIVSFVAKNTTYSVVDPPFLRDPDLICALEKVAPASNNIPDNNQEGAALVRALSSINGSVNLERACVAISIFMYCLLPSKGIIEEQARVDEMHKFIEDTVSDSDADFIVKVFNGIVVGQGLANIEKYKSGLENFKAVCATLGVPSYSKSKYYVKNGVVVSISRARVYHICAAISVMLLLCASSLLILIALQSKLGIDPLIRLDNIGFWSLISAGVVAGILGIAAVATCFYCKFRKNIKIFSSRTKLSKPWFTGFFASLILSIVISIFLVVEEFASISNDNKFVYGVLTILDAFLITVCVALAIFAIFEHFGGNLQKGNEQLQPGVDESLQDSAKEERVKDYHRVDPRQLQMPIGNSIEVGNSIAGSLPVSPKRGGSIISEVSAITESCTDIYANNTTIAGDDVANLADFTSVAHINGDKVEKGHGIAKNLSSTVSESVKSARVVSKK